MRNYFPLAFIAALSLVVTTFYAQQRVLTGRYVDGTSFRINVPVDNCNDETVAVNNGSQVVGNKWFYHLENSKAFVENKGQFNSRDQALGENILFGFEDGATFFYFTKDGWGYRLDSLYKNPNRQKGDDTKPKWIFKSDLIRVSWVNSNSKSHLIPSEKFDHTNTYAVKRNDKSVSAIEGVLGYGKLTNEDIYQGINLVYTMHPDRGIEYRLDIDAQADVASIKMKYPVGSQLKIDVNGDLLVSTLFGSTRESKPKAYYADNHVAIEVNYKIEGNVVSFALGSYDSTRSIVIDPWVQTPTLPISNGVWECESDGAGNVYIIGGDSPMKLQKYNAAGVLQWTYNTPWDTASGAWLGALAVDFAGNSFVSNGTVPAAIHRVSTAGTQVWTRAGGAFDEFWTIVFNCDQTKLIVGGTNTGLLPPSTATGRIFDVNTSNGNINGNVITTTTTQGPFIQDINEVRAISSSRNAKYYFLTLDTIGAISQDFNLCPSNQGPLFKTSSSYKFSYKCENYKPNGNSGICAIRANDKFVYTQNGTTIAKRSLASGNVISSASIPGGVYSVQFGYGAVGNSGIAIDSCGNVYAGSSDRVVKFDENLNIITSVNVPFRVYDVAVSTSGNIIVCGASGNPANPQVGYVQSINMSACVPFALICCNPTICPAGPICDNASPITLTSGTAGGVWSGAGITNASTGQFSPSVAGPGVHKIVYTLPCGADSVFITVNACANLIVCRETNGDYTVSGGQGPYTWQSGVAFQNCSGCFGGNCIPFICPGFADTTWTTFGTTATATPPGTFPIRVTDVNGNRLKLTSAAGIQPCTTCPNYTTTITSQTNITCTTPTGSATVSSTGGTSPYTYNWTPGNLTGATRTGLAAGAYTVIATDAASCRDTVIVTITSSGSIPTVNVTSTATTCGLANGSATANVTGGTAPFTYAWSPGTGSTQTISNLASGTYTVIVTGAGGCTATASGTVAASTGFTTAVTTTPATCTANNGTATATNTGGTGPFTYSWSPSGGIGATASNLAPGTYTVQVNDVSGCTATASGTVTQSSGTLALSLTNPINPTCAGNDGSITAGLSGGIAPYTVTIDTGGTPIVLTVPFAISQTISNLPDGTVNVTVVDAQGCQVNNSATLTAPNCCTFTVSAVLTQPTCGQANGQIVITPANGSGNYTYVWANGSGTGNTASNLNAGSYSVTITDNGFANCFIDTIFTLNSNSSLALSLTNPVNPTCAGNDGSITVGLSGGTTPYTVTIDTGGTPIVLTVPFAISQTVNNLPDGTVNVTVVDAQGCQVNNSATLTLPANCCTFTISAALTQPGCTQSNGSIVITPANGSGNYSYTWANGSGIGNTGSNLAAGTYDVTITDNGFANCFIDTSFTLSSTNTVSILLSNQTSPTCANSNGSFTLGINGGTAPYVVTIDTGGASPVILNIASAGSQVVGNLPAGNVAIVGTDAQGCQAVAALTLFPPANCCTFTISAAITQPSCGLNDGSIAITPANGSGNYTYGWANGAGSGSTASNLAAGTYDVTITDNGFANCFIDTSFTLTNPNAPTLSFVRPVDIPCGGDSTGSTNLVIAGGTGPFTILWSTGDTTLTITGYPAGTYTVTVTDANGCVASNSHPITELPAMVLQLTATPINCTDSTSGSAGVTVSGGTSPYGYAWSNAGITANLNNVTVGWYIVTVTDAAGCIAIDSVEVTGDNISAFNLGPNLNICFGDTVILGTGLAGTVWSTGDTSDYLVVTEAGTYYGTITSGTCTNSDTVTIFVEQLPTEPQLNVNDTIVCESETLILRVDNEGHLYVWSTGDTATQIVVDTPGIYVVTAINNCGEISAEALVTDSNCACRLYLPNAFSPNNDGNNDVLKVYTQCTEIEEFNFSIFDRWGGLVYRSNNFLDTWNGMSKGKNCIPGVYVYSISYLSRENGVRQIQRQKGSITLLR